MVDILVHGPIVVIISNHNIAAQRWTTVRLRPLVPNGEIQSTPRRKKE
jgi:hypothetical protein